MELTGLSLTSITLTFRALSAQAVGIMKITILAMCKILYANTVFSIWYLSDTQLLYCGSQVLISVCMID